MILFLDFDRTIFDSDCFINTILDGDPLLEEHVNQVKKFAPGAEERRQAWHKITDVLDSGAASLSKENLPECLFDDSLDFLTKHKENIVIVTFGFESFQKAKVEGALPSLPFKDALYVEKGEKGEVIKEWLSSGNTEEAIFVDDLLSNLESVEKECPWIVLYEMRRDGGEGSGKYPVLKNLNELNILLSK